MHGPIGTLTIWKVLPRDLVWFVENWTDHQLVFFFLHPMEIEVHMGKGVQVVINFTLVPNVHRFVCVIVLMDFYLARCQST
jgi:hypothetical protein